MSLRSFPLGSDGDRCRLGLFPSILDRKPPGAVDPQLHVAPCEGPACAVHAHVGANLELMSGGGIALPGVVRLGVQEARGDSMGCLTVVIAQVWEVMELRDSGQVVGDGRTGKTRDKVILSRVLLAPYQQSLPSPVGFLRPGSDTHAILVFVP